MTCNICLDCVIGEKYSMATGICYICSSPIPAKDGIYLGKDDEDHHLFKVINPFTCPECKTFHECAFFYCGDMNITNEFIQINESSVHWVGQ